MWQTCSVFTLAMKAAGIGGALEYETAMSKQELFHIKATLHNLTHLQSTQFYKAALKIQKSILQ